MFSWPGASEALWCFLWVSGSMGQFSRVLTSGASEASERSSLVLPLGFHGPLCMHCSAAVWCFSLLAAAALGASAAAGLVAPCWNFWSLAVACFNNFQGPVFKGLNKWGERSERAKLSGASSGFPWPIVHALLCCCLVLFSACCCCFGCFCCCWSCCPLLELLVPCSCMLQQLSRASFQGS